MYSKYLQYRYLEKVIRDCFNAQKNADDYTLCMLLLLKFIIYIK